MAVHTFAPDMIPQIHSLTNRQNRSVDNTVVLTIVSLKYTVPVEYNKTEGLELGAVDKLLVGIFVGSDGEGRKDLSPPTLLSILIFSFNIGQ
jgi:hypothetical protein